MSTFMLLLYDNPGNWPNVTPEEMQKVIAEYIAWSDKLGKEGKIEGGHKLKDEGGRVVRLQGNKHSVVDGPYTETKEVIGGYAIFEFRNKEEAVASAVEFMQLHKDLMPGWEGTCEVRAFADFSGT